MRLGTVAAFIVSGLIAIAQESANLLTGRDMAAIEQLHARDSDAAKVGDVETLATLWTADAVALPPGDQPIVGIDAIRGWLNKNRLDTTKMEITEYVMDFKEVRIVGDQAFEWARTSITVRLKGAGTDFRASGNLMRILRKQPDGNWKVARAIWNDNSSPQKTAPPRQQEQR